MIWSRMRANPMAKPRTCVVSSLHHTKPQPVTSAVLASSQLLRHKQLNIDFLILLRHHRHLSHSSTASSSICFGFLQPPGQDSPSGLIDDSRFQFLPLSTAFLSMTWSWGRDGVSLSAVHGQRVLLWPCGSGSGPINVSNYLPKFTDMVDRNYGRVEIDKVDRQNTVIRLRPSSRFSI